MNLKKSITDYLALQKSLEDSTFKDLLKAKFFNRIVTELFEDNIGNLTTLVLSYIKSIFLGVFHQFHLSQNQISSAIPKLKIYYSVILLHWVMKIMHISTREIIFFEERRGRLIQCTEGKRIWCKYD